MFLTKKSPGQIAYLPNFNRSLKKSERRQQQDGRRIDASHIRSCE
jgi:hypothetical protein